MEGGSVRGMGVTLPIIIEEPSIIELWCGGGGGGGRPIQFSTPLCVSYYLMFLLYQVL